MRSLTMVLLVLWCGNQERTITGQDGTTDGLVGKVWVATDPSAAPGTLRIFLANGTMVMDSCGETYRLSAWKRLDDRHVEWTEDGASIRAEVAALTSDRMRLTLQLKSGAKDETYRVGHRPDGVSRPAARRRFTGRGGDSANPHRSRSLCREAAHRGHDRHRQRARRSDVDGAVSRVREPTTMSKVSSPARRRG